MAIGATIYKTTLNIADMNRHYYQDFNLTMPMHPSENEERLMWRLICFCLSAHEDLQFTKGLSTQDEPELWQKDLSGDIVHWIEMGLPEEKRIKQAMGKSKKVTVYTTHPTKSSEWHEKVGSKINNPKFECFYLESQRNLAVLAQRTINLSCTIQDEVLTLSNESDSIEVIVSR